MKRFLLFVLTVAVFLGCLYMWTHRRRAVARQGTPFTPASGPVLDAQDIRVLSSIDQENTRVVEAVLPSVVSITTSKQVQTGIVVNLNDFLHSGQLRGVPKLENRSVLGSGVVVSKEGHILTNYHVIADTDKIQVDLDDGRSVPAEIIGTDPDTDIAVLRIKAENLKPLPLGNSDEVKVGQLVFAVGNPLGLQETVTHGIISAKSRVVDETSLEYFQTDAAINEGNSGGPLVDLRGEVIGINTRVASKTGGLQPQGLSFAIPSNVARRTLEAIIRDGRVVHSYLGADVDFLKPPLAAKLGVSQANGAVVTRVYPASPAESAGFRINDVVTKFNERALQGPHDFYNRVAETPVGESITLGVIRASGGAENLTAQIAARPDYFNNLKSAGPNILNGLRVAEIPAERRPALPEDVKGVMVVDIDPASAIGTLIAREPESLKVGDVIEAINNTPVKSVADFELMARQLPPGAQQTVFFICRGETRSSFTVITR